MGYEITAGSLLGGGGAVFEEFVAKRAIGAEPLAGRPREDAGPSTVRAGLFGVGVGARLGQLQQGQRLDRLRRGWSLDWLRRGWSRDRPPDGHHIAPCRLRRRCRWCR